MFKTKITLLSIYVFLFVSFFVSFFVGWLVDWFLHTYVFIYRSINYSNYSIFPLLLSYHLLYLFTRLFLLAPLLTLSFLITTPFPPSLYLSLSPSSLLPLLKLLLFFSSSLQHAFTNFCSPPFSPWHRYHLRK